MTNASFVRKPALRSLSLLEEILLGSFLGLLLFIISLFLVLIGFQVAYLGRVLPGVSLAGQSMDGLTAAQAAEKINTQITYPNTGHILLYDPVSQKNWRLTPAQMGLLLDSDASVQNAIQVGRSGNLLYGMEEQIAVFFQGKDVAPVMVFDDNLGYTMLSQIANDINRPMINANLTINGLEVTTRPSQSGRKLNIPATLALIRAQSQLLQDAAIPLVIEDIKPQVLDVTPQADQALHLLKEPLKINLPADQPDQANTGPWIIEPRDLVSMISLEYPQVNGQTEVKVVLNRPSILAFLSPLAPQLQQKKQNARFTFNDDTGQMEVIQSAVIGRTLNIQKSADAIQEKALQGSHSIDLELDIDRPEITDDKTGAELGITELIHEEISYYYGSSVERVQNISAASASFHGVLIAPGQVVSMADIMGDVSLDNGYAEALIISGGKTITGVGGGVCQVSTTLFRAAFFSGYPILERYSHAYRVGYYEYDPGGRRNPQYAGLDATVFVPVVDFKFKNDSNTWLLMETYVNPSYSTLIWKFYGTKDGRSVEWETTGPTNIVDHPKPQYNENPELPAGEVKQIDYAADGADVSVHRIVRRDGQVLYDDTFTTHYQPWQAVYEYGPGTEGMPPPEESPE